MARTIPQLHQFILTEISARPELAGLTSPSATAIYRLVAYVVAAVLWTHETLWDRHKADVDATVARAVPGIPKWYADQVLKFQLGDVLTVDDDGIHYAPGSTGARIVTRAVAKENDLTGKLFVKVAKNGVAPGTLASLSAAELTQVKGYLNRIRFAGTRIEVVSREADRLRVAGEVYYDPLVDLPTLKDAVRAALLSYLSKLEFDGLVYVARIEDAIQAVASVKDVRLVSVQARTGAALPETITRVYETAAGYIVEEDAAGFTFVDTLTFLPHGAV